MKISGYNILIIFGAIGFISVMFLIVIGNTNSNNQCEYTCEEINSDLYDYRRTEGGTFCECLNSDGDIKLIKVKEET